MYKVILMALMVAILSCSTAKKSDSLLKEEELYSTRKYIGNFLGYYHTGPQVVDGQDLIWIKTTVYTTYGSISAYGKSCDFAIGDKIYLKTTSNGPDDYGNWEYLIENDYLVAYKVSDIKFENNVFIRSRSF
jgi:hypothetical protein